MVINCGQYLRSPILSTGSYSSIWDALRQFTAMQTYFALYILSYDSRKIPKLAWPCVLLTGSYFLNVAVLEWLEGFYVAVTEWQPMIELRLTLNSRADNFYKKLCINLLMKLKFLSVVHIIIHLQSIYFWRSLDEIQISSVFYSISIQSLLSLES